MASPVIAIGLIGAGTAGSRHAAALKQCEGVSLASIVDPIRSAGEKLATDSGAAYYPDASPAFWKSIDAAIICAPHDQLSRYALESIAHKVPALVEKPLALTLADIDTIQDHAEATQVPIMVGFVHRFRAELVAAFQAVQDGFLGDPTFAVEHLISGGGTTPRWIWNREIAGGGVLLYNGVHGIDRLRWLLGRELEQVYAQVATRTHDADVEDIVVATLTFSGGVSASFVQHIAPYPLPSNWRSEIYGTKGSLLIGPQNTLARASAHTSMTISAERDDRFRGELTEFVASIRELRPPSVTIADGRAALAAAHAMYRSAERGQPVFLTEFDRKV